METVRRFAGRAYFDLTALQWAFYDAMGVLPRDANVSLGGHQPEIPVSSDPFVGLAGQWRQFRGVKLVFKLIAFARKYETMIRRTFELAARLRETDWRRLTGAQTAERLQEVADAQARFAVPFQMGNTAAGVWHEPLLMLLKLYLPAEQAKATAARLMTGSGMVASAEHGYRLLEVAEAARGEAAAREYLDRTPPDPHGWRKLPEVSPFRRAMEAFLAEFGHRGIYEIDMANPRWSEDPTYLLEQVRSMLAAGAGGLDRRTARARRAAAEAELAKCPWWLRPLLRRVVFRARVAAAQRENGKSTLVALLWPMRIAALEVARRLMEQGRLVTPEDVFTLTWSDLLSYLHGEWDGAGAADLVADRKAVIERWRTQNPPDAFVVDAFGREAEMPKSPAAPAAPTAPAPAVDGRVLTGTAASAGRATGKARIIRHPDEGARLLAGEVLVAPSTDPGWTPLFLRASAVVMEVGGYLSHGAIVAREYGIPAVVNVPKLLEKVTDGARLVVDGDAGRVEIGD
jgi:pyruvate,water dikinase